jgi:hypothetical protein
VNARHPDARFTYTWRRDSGSFYPGKLDFLLYTGSTLILHRNFVLDTRSMTAANLAAHGLQAGDTGAGSDHAPVVADFTSKPAIGVPEDEATGLLFQNAPNPFTSGTVIRFRLLDSGPARLRIFDTSGRLVTTLLDVPELPPTETAVTWNGRDGAGHEVAPGIYYYRLDCGDTARTRRMTRIH